MIDHKNLVGVAHGLEPVGDHDDRLVVGQFCNGLHFLHGGVGLAEADVVGNRVREQVDPLEHEGEVTDEAVVAVFPYIPSAKAHTA